MAYIIHLEIRNINKTLISIVIFANVKWENTINGRMKTSVTQAVPRK